MARARVDSSIKRQSAPIPAGKDGVGGGDFEFPLGVYPVEPLTPIEGYTIAFESADDGPPPLEGGSSLGGNGAGGGGGGGGGGRRPADRGEPAEPWETEGDDSDDESSEREFPEDLPGMDGEGDLEPWPDRYVFDINIRASRVESLCRQLFAMLPGRVFPILDVMGNDGYREIDPYIAYDLVGVERFLDAVRRFKGWFFEDGMVGFGAMSEEPFVYVFVDEHKIVTVRVAAGAKEQVEKILRAFDLQEVDKIAGADAAVHEHRGVLDAPSNRPDLLTHDEIVEQLRDDWGLTLNVDPFHNLDENNNKLGVVPWRSVIRVFDEKGEVRYAEVFLTADSLQAANELAVSAAESLLVGDDPTGMEDGKPAPLGDASDSPSTEPPAVLGKIGGKPVDKPGEPPTESLEGVPEVLGEFPRSVRGSDDEGEGVDFGNSIDADLASMDDIPMDIEEFDVLVADRIKPEDVDQFPALAGKRLNLNASRVLAARWVE
ncbi:MAG: hypothetical protein QM783_05980 [Phycisphaerales bacterium]